MTPKARHIRNSPHDRAISVDDLFAAAFNRSEFFYQRESLLGWRPVTNNIDSNTTNDHSRPIMEKPTTFTNSPDIKVREAMDSILIEVMLPDIDEDSLFLEISGDLLIIRAQRADAGQVAASGNKDTDQSVIHRYVKLPVNAQPGNVQARIDKNLLRVIINKPWNRRG